MSNKVKIKKIKGNKGNKGDKGDKGDKGIQGAASPFDPNALVTAKVSDMLSADGGINGKTPDNWLKIYGTAEKGTAIHNSVAIGNGGLAVGSWDENVPAGHIRATNLFVQNRDIISELNDIKAKNLAGEIQYPGKREGSVGYATDGWGNIFTPDNGPNKAGDNWNISGKDGSVINVLTDGSKKTIFNGPVIADGGISAGNLFVQNADIRESLKVAGRNILTELDNVKAVKASYEQVNILGTNTLNFGVGLDKEVHAGKIGYNSFDGNALNIVGSGRNGESRRVRVFDRLIVDNRDIISELDDLRNNVVRKDKVYGIQSSKHNKFLRAWGDEEAKYNGGKGDEERVQFRQY